MGCDLEREEETSVIIMSSGCQILYYINVTDRTVISLVTDRCYLSFFLAEEAIFTTHGVARLEKNFKSLTALHEVVVDAAAVWWWNTPSLVPRVLNDFRRPRLSLLSLALLHKI